MRHFRLAFACVSGVEVIKVLQAQDMIAALTVARDFADMELFAGDIIAVRVTMIDPPVISASAVVPRPRPDVPLWAQPPNSDYLCAVAH